jgi:hypothetical protein
MPFSSGAFVRSLLYVAMTERKDARAQKQKKHDSLKETEQADFDLPLFYACALALPCGGPKLWLRGFHVLMVFDALGVRSVSCVL